MNKHVSNFINLGRAIDEESYGYNHGYGYNCTDDVIPSQIEQVYFNRDIVTEIDLLDDIPYLSRLKQDTIDGIELLR